MRRKGMTVLVCLVLMGLLACGLAQESEQETTTPVTTEQVSCSIMQSGEDYLVYCFAQVHNASDSTVFLDEGLLRLHNGEQLLAEQEASNFWPYFLGPGEVGYLFDVVVFEPNEDGVVVPSVTALEYEFDCGRIDAQYANAALKASVQVQEDPQEGYQLICMLQNDSDMDAFDPTVAFGLYAENGALIYADGMTLQRIGIPAGGETLLRLNVDDAFIEQWSAYGVKPAEVRVNASFRADED